VLNGCWHTTNVQGEVVASLDIPSVGTAALVRSNGTYFAYLAQQSATGWKIYTDNVTAASHVTEGVPIRWVSATYERNGKVILVWGGTVNDPEVVKIVARGQEYNVSDNFYLFAWSGVNGEYDFMPAYALNREGRTLYEVRPENKTPGWIVPQTTK